MGSFFLYTFSVQLSMGPRRNPTKVEVAVKNFPLNLKSNESVFWAHNRASPLSIIPKPHTMYTEKAYQKLHPVTFLCVSHFVNAEG